MRHPVGVWLGVIPLLLGVISCAALQAESVHREPVEHVYASPVGSPLKAYVFSPEKPGEGRRSAIVLIHGGGWTMGDPRWAFSGARHFAERGMVAIAAQYRLSDQKNITPIEAMEDVRAVIRWMRVNAESLGIVIHNASQPTVGQQAPISPCPQLFSTEAIQGRHRPEGERDLPGATRGGEDPSRHCARDQGL